MIIIVVIVIINDVVVVTVMMMMMVKRKVEREMIIMAIMAMTTMLAYLLWGVRCEREGYVDLLTATTTTTIATIPMSGSGTTTTAAITRHAHCPQWPPAAISFTINMNNHRIEDNRSSISKHRLVRGKAVYLVVMYNGGL